MNFLKLCNDDPLLQMLIDIFNANPIRIPEYIIQPLSVFSKTTKNVKFIGTIKSLLADSTEMNIQVQESVMANVSSTKTKAVDAKTGIEVMDGFLKGLGSNAASFEFAFKGVKKVSFAFENILRRYVDIGLLMKILTQRKVDVNNPVVKNFIDEVSECILVDSTITSNNFSIKVEKSSSADFSFDLPEIQKVLQSQGNSLQVMSSGTQEISFKGEKQLAFAFTGFGIKVNDDGTLYYEGEPDRMHLTRVPTATPLEIQPTYLMLGDEVGLAEIEMD
ncbi:MAG: hypothetical protein JWP69_1687 [Flaviaesturariibacter sp.]|nr:hypothetical protein [Flaviaesturariibacter sp.]